ncbi:actin-related protein Arp2 [Volvox carteri f. nagariensis]|uniref:Actin-related protein Arp2 n=1 Tax=Volvox carteri f. nagariensis TaxID=3068 RepID=D8UFJ7_VOLCA|nr:actin-related protein Arp2 [Volvox carteri f. nagariensis]EFJ41468.1 actin-related protein Arp2 [Volvox carteri f. nagariensis]|eukprot:XP_002957413.1 actin-related protein Arp2 [Volvox carteri f. nagariensis]
MGDFPRNRVVVCDNGTGLVKCGFAGDSFPRAVFPCLVGRPTFRYNDPFSQQQQLKDIYVGTEASSNKAQLELLYPMRNGIVQSWDDMGLIWDHAFSPEQLNVDPSECRILLTDPAMNPTANRQRMLEVMFEKYGFSGANMQIQAVLTLYAQGLLTGLVLDSGDGVSHAVAVVDGYAFPHQTKRLNVAGRHVTSHLLELLQRRGYALSHTSDLDTVRDIKERLAYVAFDYQKELKLARETTQLMRSYTLPDGRVIRLGPERFMAPEAMFNPRLLDVEAPGIAEMAFNAIQDAPIDNRRALYEHIVVSGGSTMYPGMSTRMDKEIRTLYVERVLKGDRTRLRKLKLHIADPPNRKYMVFLGGAVLADIMKDHTDFWITREQYQEDPGNALKKCGVA